MKDEEKQVFALHPHYRRKSLKNGFRNKMRWSGSSRSRPFGFLTMVRNIGNYQISIDSNSYFTHTLCQELQDAVEKEQSTLVPKAVTRTWKSYFYSVVFQFSLKHKPVFLFHHCTEAIFIKITSSQALATLFMSSSDPGGCSYGTPYRSLTFPFAISKVSRPWGSHPRR